jgi:uncharacterized protein (DUF58 family)
LGDVSLLIIVLLLIAAFLRIDFVFYIVYVIAGVYLWSRWHAPRAFRNIHFKRTFESHAFLGERISVTLTLHNRNRLPLPWLQVAESVPPQLRTDTPPNVVLSLSGNESTQFNYDIQPTRRGYYRLGPLHLRGGDLFGWSEQNGLSEPSYLTVYPRITPLVRLGFPSRLPFGSISSKQRLFEDPSRPIGVRDYRSGDSLRQINWKVSAHTDNLVERTLQPAIALDTAIVLNLARDNYDRRTRYSAPEWAIEVAASLAAHLIERQQAVGLMTNGRDPLSPTKGQQTPQGQYDEASGRLLLVDEEGASDVNAPQMIPPRGGRAHLMSILELLARIEPANAGHFAVWIPRACVHLSWGVTVPVITPKADDLTFQALHHLVRAGLNPVLILTVPNHRFGAIRDHARQLGFVAYHICDSKDMDVWQHRRQVLLK